VVTDLSEARRTEVLLRALAQRVVQGQEAERGRVAVDLHDHITQLLCAILFRSQALVAELSASGGPSMREAMKLREMLGSTASEVERISHNLRPSVLDQLGLEAGLRAVTTDFADRTGVVVKLLCAKLNVRPPAEAELALFRILQEALRNVQTHARASHVTVALSQQGDFVRLRVSDDGVGFDPGNLSLPRKGRGGLGLLGMRERASYVGGTLEIVSARRKGTEIEVNIPLIAGAAVGADLSRAEALRPSSRRA
jgi:signal transduction histidine kinase